MDQDDYHIMKQSKLEDTYDHDTCIGLYSTIEQQIREDAMLLRQIYEEEQKQFEGQIKQVERSNEYHLNLIRNQTIPNQSNFVRKDREDLSTYFGVPYRMEIQTPISEINSFQRDKSKRKISR